MKESSHFFKYLNSKWSISRNDCGLYGYESDFGSS